MIITRYFCLVCVIICSIDIPFANAIEKSNFFKVPHDPNKIYDEDRGPRLVDNKTDPDMVKLKDLQNQFFSIVSNSSIGREFNGFSDVLSLIDSKEGRQLGGIIMRGVGIGFRKKNSLGLLNEFWEDIHYRLPSDFIGAMTDYADFIKSVDVSLIPMTLELLFKKDAMGNSLAQMPLGQLIDMVQPEASRYGIDIRSFINGIIGKGDGKFPEMVKKTLENFNLQTIAQSILGFIPKTDKSSDDNAVAGKTSQIETTVHLFKPLIANLLKDNNVDLDVDAVMHVVTPFVEGAGEYISKTFSNGKGNMNLATLLPGIIAMVAGVNKKGDDPLALAANLLNGFDKENGLMNVLNLANTFMGDKESAPNGENNNGINNILQLASQFVSKGDGLDTNNLLKTAASMLSNADESKTGADMMDIVGKISRGEGLDPSQLLSTAASLINGMENKVKSEPDEPKKKTENPQKTEKKPYSKKPEKEPDFGSAIKPMVEKFKKNKSLQKKVKAGMKFVENAIQKNKINKKSIESLLLSLSGRESIPDSINLEVLSTIFTFSRNDWREFLHKLSDDIQRQSVVEQATVPVAQIITMLSSDDFDNQVKEVFADISANLDKYGIEGVTIDNFHERMEAPLQMLTMFYKIPMDFKPLLLPLKKSVDDLISWRSTMAGYVSWISKSMLSSYVGDSIDKDVFIPLIEVSKHFEKLVVDQKCLPKAVCDVVSQTDNEYKSSLNAAATRLFSFGFSVGGAYKKRDFEMIADLFFASFTKLDNCITDFPEICRDPQVDRKEKIREHHARVHDDL